MKERRRVERVVPMLEPKGRCWLYVKDLCLNVDSINDISPCGVNVYVDSAIYRGFDVRLNYKDRNSNLLVHGSVVWSNANKDKAEDSDAFQSCRASICLEPQERESNLQFFSTITDSSWTHLENKADNLSVTACDR